MLATTSTPETRHIFKSLGWREMVSVDYEKYFEKLGIPYDKEQAIKHYIKNGKVETAKPSV